MKRFDLFIFSGILVLQSACTSGNNSSTLLQAGSAEQEIVALENSLLEIAREGNPDPAAEMVEKRYTDDYIHTHSTETGAVSVADKKLLLSNINDQKKYETERGFETLKYEDKKVQVSGDVAVLRGRALVRSHVQAKAGAEPEGMQITRTFVKQDGEWKYAASHTSAVRGKGNNRAVEQILALEKDLEEYTRRNQFESLSAFIEKNFATDFICTMEDGQTVDRAFLLAHFAPDKERDENSLKGTFRFDDLQVKLHGDAAVVTGKLMYRSQKQSKADAPVNEARVTHFLIRENNNWKFAGEQLTRIPVLQAKK
jgi:ketosteroid isomerase-like protein